uniref:Uncharacterized protein n=1 Tax=Avena sativa TaxID=4498 RepID=A0ACD5XPF3_AVESA
MDDVAASLSKKRRQGELEPKEPLGSTDGSGGENTGLDLISCLPDEILGNIISLLPIKCAVQTSLLSPRWRHLWCSAPLNLVVDCSLSGQEHDRIAIVSKILATHPGPARRLSLGNDGDGICLCRDLYAKFCGWFQSPALDGLEELEVACFRNYYLYSRTRPRLPPYVLRFAPTLRIANISGCDFPENTAAAALHLPHLMQLKLFNVTISESAIQRLLAGCTVLESLELGRINGLSSVRIISPTLRTVGISVSCNNYKAELFLQEFVIEDAPCLERLIPFGRRNYQMTIRVIAAPKLTVLGCLSSEISKLVLGSIILKEMVPISLISSVRTVKVLVLESVGPDLDSVVGLLRCFPCVEKLYIMSDLCKDMENTVQYDTLDPMECLELHLKAIVLSGYQGKGPDVDFAKFFVLNAKVLEVMRFSVLGTCFKKWKANQQRRLQLNDRASKDARFDFEKADPVCRLSYNKHMHDMWMADPFDSSLCKCCGPA